MQPTATHEHAADAFERRANCEIELCSCGHSRVAYRIELGARWIEGEWCDADAASAAIAAAAEVIRASRQVSP